MDHTRLGASSTNAFFTSPLTHSAKQFNKAFKKFNSSSPTTDDDDGDDDAEEEEGDEETVMEGSMEGAQCCFVSTSKALVTTPSGTLMELELKV